MPLVPAAGWPQGRQGFVRIDNSRQPATEAKFVATDDAGNAYTLTMSVAANEARHFNSDDLENGNAKKGLIGIGTAPEGSWRLCFTAIGQAKPSAYIRTTDGLLTDMTMTVEASLACESACPEWRVPIFNPGKNNDQVSILRLINNSDRPIGLAVSGVQSDGEVNVDANGDAMVVRGYIDANHAVEVSAQQLESGDDIPFLRCNPADEDDCVSSVGSLGTGTGKWSLYINRLDEGAPSDELVVMNLMRTPTGSITPLPASAADPWVRR